MSLSKIPLIIGVCFAFEQLYTSPNPLPPMEERLKNGNPPLWYTLEVCMYATRVQFFAGIIETLTILAYQYPSSPLSRLFLSLFVLHGGNAANLRLSTLTMIGWTLIITGTLLRLATYRYLGTFYRFQASIQHNHQLVTEGPYSIVCHPGYSAILISHTGWFLWQFGQGSWVRESGLWNTVAGKVLVALFAMFLILGSLGIALTRMGIEDKVLRQRFGKEWDEYARRVRYSVLPGVY